MAITRWSEFIRKHPRPFMIFADLEPGAPQTRFDFLRRLTTALDPSGECALLPEKGFVRVAFELLADAEKFADGVLAKKIAREGGLGGQWSFLYASEMQAKIEEMLRASKRVGTPRAGATRKLKRRLLPF